MPTFPTSSYSDQALPGLVRDVCRCARPSDPHAVTQDEFNATRAAAGHLDAPGAARICTRLHIPWAELKQTALDPKRSHTQTVAAPTRREEAPWIGEDACVFALQLVATRRDVDQLSPSEYDETADEIRREHARRWAHGSNGVRRATLGIVGRRLSKPPSCSRLARSLCYPANTSPTVSSSTFPSRTAQRRPTTGSETRSRSRRLK